MAYSIQDPVFLVLLGGAAVGGLFALFIASRFFNPMILLLASFMLLAPISAAAGLGALHVVAKYARAGTTTASLLLGTFVYHLFWIRPAGLFFLTFVAFYVISGIWSEAMVWALMNKGLYAMIVVVGLMSAYSIRTLHEFKVSMRILCAAAAGFAVLMLFNLVFDPGAIMRVGRFEPWAMNPNRVGQTAAPMLLCCAYVALYDSSRWAKLAAFATGTALAIIILYTGSRGAAGQAAIGCFIIGIPLMRRPVLAATVLAISALIVYVALETIDLRATERIQEATLQSREQPWAVAMETFRENPMLGAGWVYNVERGVPTAANMHSIYMQMLAEAGLVGILIMAFALIATGARVVRNYKFVLNYSNPLTVERTAMYFALGGFFAVLAHGAIEAGTVRGSTVNGVLLAFAIGLADRIPELLREERAAERQEDAAADYEYEYGYDDGEYEPDTTPRPVPMPTG